MTRSTFHLTDRLSNGVLVSTIGPNDLTLGMYETLVERRDGRGGYTWDDSTMTRYTSEQDARAGHAERVHAERRTTS